MPKLSFFGETRGFLTLTDGLSPTVCADAAVKGTITESKSNSNAHALAIARVSLTKWIVNKQSPFRAHLFSSDPILAQVAQSSLRPAARAAS